MKRFSLGRWLVTILFAGFFIYFGGAVFRSIIITVYDDGKSQDPLACQRRSLALENDLLEQEKLAAWYPEQSAPLQAMRVKAWADRLKLAQQACGALTSSKIALDALESRFKQKQIQQAAAAYE